MNPKKSSWLLQVLIFLVVIVFFSFLGKNTVANLDTRGIATGFSFFERPAGFDIAFSLVPYNAGDTFLKAFWVGLSNTILVSVLAVTLASVLGLFVAIMRMSENPLLRLFGRVYIETFRNLPLLLQLFFWYFVVLRQLPSPRQSHEFAAMALNIRGLYIPFPEHPLAILLIVVAVILGLVLGHFLRLKARNLRIGTGQTSLVFYIAFTVPVVLPVLAALILKPYFEITYPVLEGFNYSGGLQIIPELLALVLALSIYTASFIGEIIRAGVESLPAGQREASYALGLSRFRSFKEVILPQALRVIIPPLSSQYMNITKNSSLAAAIAFPDLVLIFAGTSLNVTGQALEIMAITLSVYLILSLSISFLMNLYLRKISLYAAR